MSARRVLHVAGALAAVAIAVAGFGTAAHAQTPTPPSTPDPWTGSAFRAGLEGSTVTQPGAVTIDGSFTYTEQGSPFGYRISQTRLGISAIDSQPSNCTPSFNPDDNSGATYPPPANPITKDFAFPVDFPCNGRYGLSVVATATGTQVPPTVPTKQIYLNQVTVAQPGPTPDSAAATRASDGTITIEWTPAATTAQDLQGFEVTRIDAGGHRATRQTGTGITSVTDPSPPAGGGQLTYEVRTLRAGADPSAPATASVDLPGPTTTTSSTVRGATTTTVAGATTTTTRAAGSGGSSGGGGAGGSGTSRTTTRSGTSGAAVEPDEGFQDTLPYEAEPGGEALPGSAGEVGVSAREPGRGIVIPGAIALVLGVWAGHALYVIRLARAADAALLPISLEHPA